MNNDNCIDCNKRATIKVMLCVECHTERILNEERENNMTEFKNETDLKFIDISSEKERVYYFPNGNHFTIKHPKLLNVSASGGHRVFDGEYCYYIQPKEGWAIKWETNVNEPHFVQ